MNRRNRFRQFTKRAAALVLAGALLAGCAACDSAAPEDAGDERQGKGRYVETQMPTPPVAFSMHALAQHEGELRLLTASGVYRWADGENWERMELGGPALSEAEKTFSIVCGQWLPDGGLVYAALGSDPETKAGRYEYYLVDSSGAEHELPIVLPDGAAGPAADPEPAPEGGEEEGGDGSTGYKGSYSTTVAAGDDGEAVVYPAYSAPSKMALGPDGTLLILDAEGGVHQVDMETGQVLHSLPRDPEWAVRSLTVVGNTLVMDALDGADLYDLDTWESLEPDEALNQFLTGRTSDGETDPLIQSSEERNVSFIGNGKVQLFNGGEDDVLYISGPNGIYRHLMGGTSIEQLVVGGLTSLRDPSISVNQVIKTEDNVFFALFNSVEAANGDGVLRYDYDPDLDATPANELKAFAFYEEQAVLQAISAYQKAHPDVFIDLEVALGYESAMTKSDCLRVLNTEIMAGKGPDLIFLDNMPLDNYINKGMLADLSDVVDETAGQEALLENVVRAYQRDGSLCAVPTRFSMPLLVAPRDLLGKVTDVGSLARLVEDLRRENPRPGQISITGMQFGFQILERLYLVCAPGWFREDGSLDREALREYLQAAKTIYDAENLGLDENDSATPYYSYNFASMMGSDLRVGNAIVSLEEMQTCRGYAFLVTNVGELEDYDFRLAPCGTGNVFAPKVVVGVNAKSEHMDVAKDLVKYMLSSEHQGVGADSWYIPVNTKGYQEMINSQYTMGYSFFGADGEEFHINSRKATGEEMDRLIDMFSALDTPTPQDSIIYDAVLEQAVTMLAGEISLDDCVENIMSRVELYLSEA